jgi:hypothetical protein
MRHRFLALVVTLAFVGSLPGPIPAAARAVCARCTGAMRCCCAKAQGGRGCALARPCAPADREEGISSTQDSGKALPAASVATPAAAPRAGLVQPDIPSRLRALAVDPPDPPPRFSA